MIESSEDEEEDPEICPVCLEKNDPTNPGVSITKTPPPSLLS